MARPAKKTFGLTPTQQNSINLDPQRGMLSMNTANVPGLPTTQNNTPDTAITAGPSRSSISGINEFPYRDKGLVNDPRLGTNGIMPANVPMSQLRSTSPVAIAGRGKNANAAYNLQQQIPMAGNSTIPDQLEGQRLMMSTKGMVPANPGMGLSYAQVPGAQSIVPGSNGPMLMQGMPSAEMAVQSPLGVQPPGTNKTVINKKGERVA